MLKLFITATDTDAGKTYVAQALVQAFIANNIANKNSKVAVYKPISAGCDLVNNVLINEDAKLLLAQSNCGQTIQQVNPIAFQPAIAPHIAAAQENTKITLAEIAQGYKKVTELNPDVLICEGAGGWRLPLGNGKFLSQFVQATKQKVILVVNMKLGCLNHAVLSYETIIADGLKCVGWIANNQENMPYLAENLAELSAILPIPKLAELNYNPDIANAASKIDLSVFE